VYKKWIRIYHEEDYDPRLIEYLYLRNQDEIERNLQIRILIGIGSNYADGNPDHLNGTL
jgi:hypothetical protein